MAPVNALAAGYLSVRPFPKLWGTSYLVDAGVQVHDDVDCRNQDLGGDEDNDWTFRLASYVCIKAQLQKEGKKGVREYDLPIHSRYSPCFVPT